VDRDSHDRKTLSGEQIYVKILESRAPVLLQYMGADYAEAVKAFLEGDVDEGNFATKVLARLGGISVAGFATVAR